MQTTTTGATNGRTPPPLLQVEDLWVEFRTREGIVRAVNGVSFAIGAGETLGIVGESGSGKSVTALSLIGLVAKPAGRVTGGQVLFGGRDLLTLDERSLRDVRGKDIAMIFQDPMSALNPLLPIGVQIAEVVEIHLGRSRDEGLRRAADLLDLVGIPSSRDRLGDYPYQFSGGMRQRVMIAMALACEPKLLLADEPTTALDVTIQAQILELLRRLRRDLGMAIVLISHDLGVIAGLCDRVAVMYAGEIVEQAPVDELFTRPRHPYTMSLLHAIPDPTREVAELFAIEGAPPDMRHLPSGCPFRPRCVFAFDRCEAEHPVLELTGPDHLKRCWAPEEVLAGGLPVEAADENGVDGRGAAAGEASR